MISVFILPRMPGGGPSFPTRTRTNTPVGGPGVHVRRPHCLTPVGFYPRGSVRQAPVTKRRATPTAVA